MPSGFYNKGLYEIGSGGTNLVSSTIKAMLLKSTAAFNRDHNFVSDVVAHEVSVAGYARQTLANKAVTENDTLDAAYWDADNIAFGTLAAGQTVKFVVFYRDTGADGTSPLLACWQLVETATDGTAFSFTPNAAGLAKIWSAT
jgi:hypothetical protein